MRKLPGGIVVASPRRHRKAEETPGMRVPISRSMGARDIRQSVQVCTGGVSRARVNVRGEEVAYVVSGSGFCHIDGFSYSIEAGTGIWLPPGSVFQYEPVPADTLVLVSVCCPEEVRPSGAVVAPPRVSGNGPRRTVREWERPSIPTGDRFFKVLVDQELGCLRVTQFLGVIPPGRTPMHRHEYEEAIYILDGEGRVWGEEDNIPFAAGASIYLPRGASHSLENTGNGAVRLLGVFHPSGSPASRYEA